MEFEAAMATVPRHGRSAIAAIYAPPVPAQAPCLLSTTQSIAHSIAYPSWDDGENRGSASSGSAARTSTAHLHDAMDVLFRPDTSAAHWASSIGSLNCLRGARSSIVREGACAFVDVHVANERGSEQMGRGASPSGHHGGVGCL